MDLVFAPVEFHGPYEGRHFPSGYNTIEQERLAHIMRNFGNPSRGALDGAAAVTVGDALFTNGLPCYAHVLVTEVRADGSLMHCQSIPEGNAGHLKDGPKLNQELQAKPCPYEKCQCISVGYNMSLKPCGITFGDYARELEKVAS